jgi:hypothetical protein
MEGEGKGRDENNQCTVEIFIYFWALIKQQELSGLFEMSTVEILLLHIQLVLI